MKIIEMLEQILLEDLDTEEGGIAYQGETLADFIEYNLEGIEDLQKLEQELKDCGIAPLEQSDKEKIKEYQVAIKEGYTDMYEYYEDTYIPF